MRVKDKSLVLLLGRLPTNGRHKRLRLCDLEHLSHSPASILRL